MSDVLTRARPKSEPLARKQPAAPQQTSVFVSPPPFNEWVTAEPCDTSPTPPASAGVTMEQLQVTGVNALAPLSNYPDQQLLQLFVNGQAFFPVGATPDFSTHGQAINWLSTIYSILPGSTVIAVYTWGAAPPASQ